MDQSQRVLVAGTGKSGIAAARLILERGGEVILYDGNEALKEEDIKENFGEDKKRVSVVLGEMKRSDLLGVELCIISPGIPLTSPFVAVVDDAKIPILGEIELAYQCSLGKLAAITGTNGKTTTTALTGEILRSHYEETFVVGNIGEPYTSKAMEMTEESVTVAEISSFQLETIMDFHPNISAILNITPDHLNRHGTMENYIQIKEGITLNQTEEDKVVLNYDDPVLREFGEDPELRPEVIWFSSRTKLADGFCMAGDDIVYCQKGRETVVVNVHEMQLLGRHNYENVMAAAAIGLSMGVPMSKITEVIKNFQPVEHRIEFVRERTGVRYYNDSKGTNPDAAIQALRAMPGPTILIAGGYDKESSYDEWVKEFEGKVKYLVLIGQTRDKIAACAKEHGFTEIMYAEDMSEAVQVCAVYADIGDYVLLSPACASWGMFRDYEERGRIFKECVMAL
ncbi:UDP-N-acetylmuramoyl-L-alanine--D-glutamate ligase [Lacrimispora sp. 210928-DFI.3.58]|uniref:UDP-N-acetylmuramoyl-L-alanine--D-glutamate ligase n=1 Tax=Lacrimispora sp. 210928-DFI.3.58 TaxID=2883214 RepID=UPI0015B71929|nr:UDP-N-acetylmuramoyl-L-alanine--D-glutamate ligase [Lacrimispora sp. 210928-DFI.3.58]MCB7318282.1 UDP-N-acetylmuramoyl-L-alanine--D-glutamate ligase [Lacrimispora sp. 210928-DFI.3.58]